MKKIKIRSKKNNFRVTIPANTIKKDDIIDIVCCYEINPVNKKKINAK